MESGGRIEKNINDEFIELLLMRRFRENNVIMIGHFMLNSKMHSNIYINKDSIFSDPTLFKSVMNYLNDRIEEHFHGQFDIVTGPAIAGALIASNIAMLQDKTYVYPEKINGTMQFRRGYDKIIRDKRVLIIEDVITTGLSVLKTQTGIERCGGEAVGVISICNRGANLDIKNVSLINFKKVMMYYPEECPMCASGEALIDPKTMKPWE